MKNTDKGVRTEEEILFQVQSCERMGGLRLNLLGRAEAPRLMGRGLNRDEIDGDMAARAFYWLKSVAGAGARRPLRRARAHPNARPSPRSTDVCHRDAFEPVKSAGGHIPVDLVPVQTSTHKSRRVSATQEI